MANKDLSAFELDMSELDGFTVDELRCSACSGYGNCGFRTYRLMDGKPVLLCEGKKRKLAAKREQQESQEG